MLFLPSIREWRCAQPRHAVRIACPATLLLSLAAPLILAFGTAFSQAAPPSAPEPSDIIQFLSQTINWYRQLNVEHQIVTEPSDILVINDDRQLAEQVVRLSFEFARGEAQALSKQLGSSQSTDQGAVSSQYQSLLQLSDKLDKDVRELQTELQSARQKLETASGKKREALQATVAEVQSELDLANARREALHSMAEFVSGASTSGLGASGLRGQIEALARSLPGDLSQAGTENHTAGAPPSSAPSPVANRVEPSGIWGLTADLFGLSRKIHSIDQRINETEALAQRSRELRAPLVNKLKQLSQQGDELAKQADTGDSNTLASVKKDFDALTAQFRQTTAAVLPLSKAGILLGLYKTNLTNWQSNVKSQYRTELRSLLVRIAILGIILAVAFGFGELWRKTIFRYVHDPRRRYQFLLLRKIVMWFVFGIIIAFAFATQLGSVATFAGLLTAGIAVALQSVILSVAGYFFLIGRFGIRVGDRVQIGGVTGEVMDIGLVRLHVMELGSGDMPTGRVVAFSNSIVFQSTAGLFKQIPGTSFVWHEITLTLSPDSDYRVVEQRLLGVVEAVFADYREDIERQHRQLERTLSYTQPTELRPTSRLRFTQAGLEAVIRFPVTLQNAAEVDDRVTRELLKAIEREPRLKLVGSGTPSIRLNTDVVSSNVSSS